MDIINPGTLENYFMIELPNKLKSYGIHFEEAGIYAAFLLTKYADSEGAKFFLEDAPGESPIEILLRINNSPNYREKLALSVVLGNRMLVKSGYLQISPQPPRIKTYISIGTDAYGNAAYIKEKTEHKDMIYQVYLCLSDKFPAFSEAIADVLGAWNTLSPTDIMRIISKWERTGSKKALKILLEQGINPALVSLEEIH